MKRILLSLFAVLAIGNFTGTAQNLATDHIDSEPDVIGVTNISAMGTLSLVPTKNMALRNELTRSAVYLKLDIGEDYVYTGDWATTLQLEASIELRSGGTPVTTIVKNFELNHDTPEQLEIHDILSDVLAGVDEVQVSVTTMPTLTGWTPEVQAFVEDNLRFTAEVASEYAVDVRVDAGGGNWLPAAAPTVVPLNGTVQNRAVSFDWSIGSIAAFPNYEIQVLRLHNADASNANNPDAVTATVNWANALRVETQSSNPAMALTVAEGTGFYIWRVRPVGTYFDGGIANSENYGVWSNAPATGDVITLNNSALTQPFCFYLKDVDENVNYLYTRVFSEGDYKGQNVRTSESITYADPLLNARQAQSYNSENDITLSNQTIPDYSGRSAFSSIPVPENGGLSGYKVGLVKSDASTLYTALDFDDDATLAEPAPMYDAASNAYEYWSSNSPDPLVPDAQGYAYARSVFKTDGTNRISEQSGVGFHHSLGTQTNQGHTTRTLYSTPSDRELLRLFGDEAPLAESVIKTITIDPNEVSTITYTSKEGKVIATGMITESTSKMSGLDDPSYSGKVENTTNQNYRVGRKYVSSRRVAVLSDGKTLTLNYSTIGPSSGSPCTLPGGTACDYSAQLLITDLNTGTRYASTETVPVTLGGQANLSTITEFVDVDVNGTAPAIPATPNSTDGNNIDIVLDEGEYLFTKVLWANNDIDLTIKNNVLDKEEQANVILDAIALLMGDVSNPDDFDAFETAMLTIHNYYNPPYSSTAAQVLTALDLDPGTTIPAPGDLSIAYDPGASTESSEMTVTMGCCNDATIGIPKPDVCVVCDEIESLMGAAPYSTTAWEAVYNYVRNDDDGFITYFEANPAVQGEASVQEALALYAPGFTLDGLAYMITNMLMSTYWTGNTLENSGTIYKATEDASGALVYLERVGGELVPGTSTPSPGEAYDVNNDPNYACKDLYECWINAVDLIASFGDILEENVNMMNTHNDRNGAGNSEDEYDDEDNRDAQKFSEKVLGFLISAKMRKFNDHNESALTPAFAQNLVLMPKIFMECAGYQFAAVLDEAAMCSGDYDEYWQVTSNLLAASSGLLPGNFDPQFGLFYSYDPSGAFEYPTVTEIGSACIGNFLGDRAPFLVDESGTLIEFEDPDNSSNVTYQLCYPQITRPEWMFKYMLYNRQCDNGIADDFPLLQNQYDLEEASCYMSLSDRQSAGCSNCSNITATAPCFVDCNYYKDSWNEGQRLNFYKQVRYAPQFQSMNAETGTVVDATATDCPDVGDPNALMDMAYDEVQGAFNRCEMRREEFRTAIILKILECGIEIDDCPNGDPTKISLKEIDLMVDGAVEACQAPFETWLDDIDNSLWTLSGSGCTQRDCYYIDENGNCAQVSGYTIELFNDCDQQRIDMASFWDFVPYNLTGCGSTGPGTGTGCPTPDAYSQEFHVGD